MNPELFEATYSEELYRSRDQLIIVLAQPWKTVSREEMVLLEKILASVKKSLNGVRIIQHSELEAVIAHSPSSVIAFGPGILPDVKLYEVASLNGSTIIKADPLNELDELKKKSLWAALQQMFSV